MVIVVHALCSIGVKDKKILKWIFLVAYAAIQMVLSDFLSLNIFLTLKTINEVPREEHADIEQFRRKHVYNGLLFVYCIKFSDLDFKP